MSKLLLLLALIGLAFGQATEGGKANQTQSHDEGSRPITRIDESVDRGGVSCGLSFVNPCWRWKHDAATPGSASGASSLVASPSQDGRARRFDFTSSGYGGERFSNYLGAGNLDTHSTSWVYDTWLYIDTTHISHIELDISQTLADGTTVIYGTQCNFTKGKWQYTGAVNPTTSKWINSNVPCTPSIFTGNVWHHVELASHRDAAGNVTYDSVTFDGSKTNFIGATVNSSFSLHFLPPGNIIINYQLDGDGTSFTSTSYLDLTTVMRGN